MKDSHSTKFLPFLLNLREVHFKGRKVSALYQRQLSPQLLTLGTIKEIQGNDLRVSNLSHSKHLYKKRENNPN